MNVQLQFSRFAGQYDRYNIIQQQVVEKLLADLGAEKPAHILDLGCGRGALYRALSWQPEHFVGVDFAPGMLELHPKGENLECVFGDFNDPGLFEHLQFITFDRIFSASALQWAEDLDSVFGRIAALQAPVSLALFTANTFATLFKTAGIPPLLRSSDEVAASASRFFDAKTEVVQYRLGFDSVREMFRYIKRSGVSSGRRVLSYKETKRLMSEYPLDYLEFEVIFIYSK